MTKRRNSLWVALLGDSMAPLRHRSFRLFWLARLISGFGSWIAPIAISFAVLDLTGSPADLGLVLAARTVPFLIFLLYGGVVADRLPRNRVLVWSNGTAAASQALAAFLLLTGQAEIWQLIAIEAVNGAGSAFAQPAGVGLTPQLVPKEELHQANALASMTGSGIRVLGLAVGGVLVATLGSGVGLAIDAATFAAAAVLFAAIGLPNESRIRMEGTWHDLREGWDEFRARRWVWVIVLGFIVINMCVGGAWFTLGPVIADESIGRGWWGGVLAANAVGALMGTAFMARFKPARPLYLGITGLLACVAVYAVLGLAPLVVLLMPTAFAMGFGGGVFGVAWYTALQTHIPGDRLSRVISHDSLWSFIAIPLGQIGAGYLGAQLGAAPVVLAAAAASGVVTLMMLATPDIRAADLAMTQSSGPTDQIAGP